MILFPLSTQHTTGKPSGHDFPGFFILVCSTSSHLPMISSGWVLLLLLDWLLPDLQAVRANAIIVIQKKIFIFFNYSLCRNACLSNKISSDSTRSSSGTQQSTGQTAAHCGSS